MCWSPKIKTPSVQTPTTPIEPAPLTEEPKGIKFGGEDDTVAESGRKTLKVQPNKPASANKVSQRVFNK